jgi:hypothetical protein
MLKKPFKKKRQKIIRLGGLHKKTTNIKIFKEINNFDIKIFGKYFYNLINKTRL